MARLSVSSAYATYPYLPLLWRRYGGGAPPHLSLTHYSELYDSHGIVLVRGDVITEKIVNVQEVRSSLTQYERRFLLSHLYTVCITVHCILSQLRQHGSKKLLAISNCRSHCVSFYLLLHNYRHALCWSLYVHSTPMTRTIRWFTNSTTAQTSSTLMTCLKS